MNRGQKALVNLLIDFSTCNDIEYNYLSKIVNHFGIEMPDIDTFKQKISEINIHDVRGILMTEYLNNIIQMTKPISKEELQEEMIKITITDLLNTRDERDKIKQN